jgi:hypothetical protein
MADTELSLLKDRATMMGIKFHPASGIKSLKEKINAKLNTELPEETIPAEIAKITAEPVMKSDAQLKAEHNVQLRKMANQLIRVNVTCMNPNKKEWMGEIFSVSNRVIGTIKKFVPFGAEAGWHVPNAILIMMKERMFQTFKVITLQNGKKGKKGFMTKEFAIEIMEPLTGSELQDLAQRQAMGNTIEQ